MSTPNLTVNSYLATLKIAAKAKAERRGRMVRSLMADVDPELLRIIRPRGYAVAANWLWPLDALHEAYVASLTDPVMARLLSAPRRMEAAA